jgi:hypothetical protein
MTEYFDNPFEKAKVLHERMTQRKQQFRSQLEAPLLKIGQLFTGQEQVNCREKPKEKLKRFRLLEDHVGFGVWLWSGTSLYIDCKEINPLEVIYWQYEQGSGDKLTRVDLSMSTKPDFSVTFSVFDELKIFPKQYRGYASGSLNLDELNEKLNELITHLIGK